MVIDRQAESLNTEIREENRAVYDMLSEKGRGAFFPAAGILGQSAEAKECSLNATVGIALEDDGSTACLPSLKKLVNLDAAQMVKYAPSYGLPRLRSTWKSMLFEKNPTLAGKSISNPVVTSALTHGISAVTNLFIDGGDSLICPEYFWGNYTLVLNNGNGASISTYPTFTDKGFNLDGLENMIQNSSSEKVVLILNFPNNPTGYTPTEEEVARLRHMLLEMARSGKKITAVIDDAYFGLVFKDGVYKESVFAELADLHENILAVKVDGPTKEDYAWGFRTGFLTYGVRGGTEKLYAALESKTAGFVRGTISNASALSQNLLLATYHSASYQKEKDAMYALLKKRFDAIEDILARHKEFRDSFTPLPFNSGYFMCVKPAEGIDAQKLRKKMVTQYSIGLIAVKGLIRVAFSSTPTDRLEEVFTALHSACQEMKRG
ncbi:MAG: aminotransferase class I/II-fold pyridoxal phosphate-dependent enzyme [Fibrobacterota bacterium]